MFQLLRRLATLDTLRVEFADAALGQTDVLDHLLLHALGNGVAGALDDGVLGDADLVLLVDVGVLLDGVAVLLSRGVHGGHLGLLGLVLGALLLLLLDLLLGLLGQRRALAGLGPVGLSEETVRLEDAFLGRLEVGSLVLVVVTAQATVRTVSRAALLDLHSLAVVGEPGDGAGDHHGLVLGVVGGDLLVRGQADLLVLYDLLLLSVDGDGVLLLIVLLRAHLNLVLSVQQSDVLLPVNLLSLGESAIISYNLSLKYYQYHHGVVIVTRAIRGRYVVALVDLVAVGLLVEGLDVALTNRTLGKHVLPGQSLVALLHGVLAGDKRHHSLELAGQADVLVLSLVLGTLHLHGDGVLLLVEVELHLDLLLVLLGRGDAVDVLEQGGLQSGVGGLGHVVDLLGQLLAVGDVKLGVVNSSGLLGLLAAVVQLLQGDLGVLLLNLLLLLFVLDSFDLLLQLLFLLRFGLAFL